MPIDSNIPVETFVVELSPQVTPDPLGDERTTLGVESGDTTSLGRW